MGRLSFLLFLFCYLPFSYSNTVLDSLKLAFEQAETDSARLIPLADLIRKNLWNDSYGALSFAIVYDSLAALTQEKENMGKGKNFLGMCYYVQSKTDLAIEYYIQSLRHFEEIQDIYYIAMLHNNIGACYQFREQYDKTIEYYEKAIKVF